MFESLRMRKVQIFIGGIILIFIFYQRQIFNFGNDLQNSESGEIREFSSTSAPKTLTTAVATAKDGSPFVLFCTFCALKGIKNFVFDKINDREQTFSKANNFSKVVNERCKNVIRIIRKISDTVSNKILSKGLW